MKKWLLVGQIFLASVFVWALIVVGFSSDISLNTAWGQEEGPVQSSALEDIEDGTYRAYVDGHNGELSVRVRVQGDKITQVQVLEHKETKGIGTTAVEQIPRQIVEKNATDDIDVVSGATVTSNAIIEAVNQALLRDSEAE